MRDIVRNKRNCVYISKMAEDKHNEYSQTLPNILKKKNNDELYETKKKRA